MIMNVIIIIIIIIIIYLGTTCNLRWYQSMS
jgi:hypothetical protein